MEDNLAIMKITLFIISLILSTISYTQTQIAYISPKKDTLMLPNDDLGYLIKDTWDEISPSERPKIIFASPQVITVKNRLLFIKEED